MSRKVLLINDMAGYGKVALSAMIPVLSHMRFELFNLPTALVSNTLDYGKFEILETTGYMRNSIAVWKELGFGFDAVSTGFIVSQEQADLVAGYCRELAAGGTRVFVDPIMGDEGRLYNGIGPETVELMRQLSACADYIVPNYTEAAALAGQEYRPEGLTRQEAFALADSLAALGARSVLITSALVHEDGIGRCVVGRDGGNGEHFIIPFDEIPVRFPGTGDIFSAVFMGGILHGKPLQEAAASAMDAVREMISLNASNADKYRGIPVESCLEVLDR